MGEFNLKFRGVRGSYPVSKANYLKYGGNTACVEVNVGGHLIILDAGTGMIDIGNDLMKKYLMSGVNTQERTPVQATVLLSHIHQDHIQGFTFFKPLHLESTKIDVFGQVAENEDLKEELSQILFGKSFPLDLGDVAGNLNIHNLADNQIIVLKENSSNPIVTNSSYEIGSNDVVISSYKSYAHPQSGVMVYKITYKDKSLVYATDKESYLGGDKKLVDFARNCTLLIHDAQYTTEDYLNQYASKQGFGHSTYEMAKEIQRQANAEKLVFFHYDPTYDDDKLDRIHEQYSGIMAQENLELDLI